MYEGLRAMTIQSHCVSFREIPQTTKIFSSFLEDFSKVARYYSYPPTLDGLKQSAASVALYPESRRTVAEVLRAQNKSFRSSDAAFKNLDRLANGAVAVVTGQQVGLFGGPAYSIYKAITAARFAAELTRQGIDAVPVFWLATEDHDLEEIDHASWVTSKGSAQKFRPSSPRLRIRSMGPIRTPWRTRFASHTQRRIPSAPPSAS
jgi:hypothetical protein